MKEGFVHILFIYHIINIDTKVGSTVTYSYHKLLICHSVLGTENKVSQRIRTNMHKIGKNGVVMEVAALYNQMKEWWYDTMIMQDAWIPKEVIRIEWMGVS